ncbi:MAG: hypothetical protein KBS81_10660, partial [Spirochaetales bacterium]|nr:hypothetical protein [Candidatus Physcosoma equi]
MALLFCLSCTPHPQGPLCEVRLNTAEPKSIMSIVYGPMDMENYTKLENYRIFYKATPLGNSAQAYGGTSDTYK